MKKFDVVSGTLTTLPQVAAANKDAQSVISSSVPATGLHGEGILVGVFNVARFLQAGETELPIGVYDLDEEFPAGAYVSRAGTLDVLVSKAGAGSLGVVVEGGTSVSAGTAGKAAISSQEFAIGTKNGGKKLQAVVTVGVLTAGSFIVRVPYVISAP